VVIALLEHTYKYESCPHCGKKFLSDYGPDFCSSRCEREYEAEHCKCTRCGDEFHEDDLNHGLCEWCEEFINERGDEIA
jgi:DNA-directed RNA polymerase subunit RPC12/RpoP